MNIDRATAVQNRLRHKTAKRASGSSPASCCASPSEILLLCYKAKQLEMCKKMLDAAGVPEWVYLETHSSVPSNSTPCRLQWYLARRKDVSEKEALQGCTLEMKRMLANVKARHNTKLTDPTP